MQNNEVSKGTIIVKKVLAGLFIIFIVWGNYQAIAGGEFSIIGLVTLLIIPKLIKAIKEPTKKE